MEHITTAAQRALNGNRSSSESEPKMDWTPKLAKFWDRMTEIYGHRWTSTRGEKPVSGLWWKAISKLSETELRCGLSTCLRSRGGWPPTLPEFIDYCRPKRENAAMYREFPPMLEHKNTDDQKARARQHIAEARSRLLGGKGGTA